MIGSFYIAAQSDRNAANGASDAACDALRMRIAVDGKDDAFEGRRAAFTESLKRMERASECTAASDRRENGRIERSAGVENSFAAPFVCVETSEFCGNVTDGVIGSGDEDDVGLEDASGNAGKSMACSDGANGGTSGSLRAGDDGGNFPVGTMQVAAQDASEAARSYNRNGGGHCA